MGDFGRTGPDEDLDVGHGGSSGSGGGDYGGDDGVVFVFLVLYGRVFERCSGVRGV